MMMADMQTEAEQRWPIPDDLCADGQTAAKVILDFFTEHDVTYHGGGGKFYSPGQWAARGESYGANSLLVITHDGGEHAGAFNLDYERYELHDMLQEKLAPHGMFAECCTSWYSAVYRR
jgi:hypothetical protein